MMDDRRWMMDDDDDAGLRWVTMDDGDDDK